jgi:hypothetical protein
MFEMWHIKKWIVLNINDKDLSIIIEKIEDDGAIRNNSMVTIAHIPYIIRKNRIVLFKKKLNFGFLFFINVILLLLNRNKKMTFDSTLYIIYRHNTKKI